MDQRILERGVSGSEAERLHMTRKRALKSSAHAVDLRAFAADAHCLKTAANAPADDHEV